METFYANQVDFDEAYESFIQKIDTISGKCMRVKPGLVLIDILYNTNCCYQTDCWDEVINAYEDHGWINKN